MTAFYSAKLVDFSCKDGASILGALAVEQPGATPQQHEAWRVEIEILKKAAVVWLNHPSAAHWGLLIEYRMLRLHRRIDAVLLAGELIFVIEFKVGAGSHDSSDVRQVEDYCLDLRDFHAESETRIILPILCSTGACHQDVDVELSESVSSVLKTNAEGLEKTIRAAYRKLHEPLNGQIALDKWNEAAYAPVPSIIEAAELLYASHTVADIHSALAGQKNLTETSDRLIEIIREAREHERKAVCFVTGVPGSGKTLTGLNAVHDPEFRKSSGASAAFLSGNTPLVEVLREALALDYVRRQGGTKADARRKSKAEIQLLMRYLEEYAKRDVDRAPHEYVIVFDEAQRAWDADYGKKKFDRAASEPTLFLEIMTRHPGWAVIIALVGGGQEINKGEGGLAEWGQSLRDFSAGSMHGGDWEIHASPHVIEGSEVTAGSTLFPDGPPTEIRVICDPSLHLPVSIRSHRCEVANAWIDAVLDGDIAKARGIAASIDHFPIYLTRSLDEMRQWLLRTTRGHRRCGLVASSNARRLRAYGLGVTLSTQDLPAIKHWFLRDRDDIRSSYSLELTATEYACQGLELDRVGLCWGGDMTWSLHDRAWMYRRLSGAKWQNSNNSEARSNTKNSYRVLMTRAREALVIWVPLGDRSDQTRPPSWMDDTAEYLVDCGVRSLPASVWPLVEPREIS